MNSYCILYGHFCLKNKLFAIIIYQFYIVSKVNLLTFNYRTVSLGSLFTYQNNSHNLLFQALTRRPPSPMPSVSRNIFLFFFHHPLSIPGLPLLPIIINISPQCSTFSDIITPLICSSCSFFSFPTPYLLVLIPTSNCCLPSGLN